jgi:hypothetical protein
MDHRCADDCRCPWPGNGAGFCADATETRGTESSDSRWIGGIEALSALEWFSVAAILACVGNSIVVLVLPTYDKFFRVFSFTGWFVAFSFQVIAFVLRWEIVHNRGGW